MRKMESAVLVGGVVVARVKVWCLYTLYALLFAAVFAVMLAMLTAAVVGIPAGLLLGVFGVAVTLFEADFIVTELSPTLMIFGGLSGAFLAAFLGLVAVKAGFMICRLFKTVKRRCDRLRGW